MEEVQEEFEMREHHVVSCHVSCEDVESRAVKDGYHASAAVHLAN